MRIRFFPSYIQHQIHVLDPYLEGFRNILDFGCGDMKLDALLVQKHPEVSITGVDVLSFSIPKGRRMHFQVYDGKRLPFSDASFDAVVSYHVFHHTKDPHMALKECMRVAKYQIVIVEPVLRYPIDQIGFRILDILTNSWKREGVSLPYTIRKLSWWKEEFQKLHLRCMHLQNVSLLPKFLPIGETYLFILKKRV